MNGHTFPEHHSIRIGTLVNRGQGSPDHIRQILPNGFESFELNFWQTLGSTDIQRLAGDVAGTIRSIRMSLR